MTFSCFSHCFTKCQLEHIIDEYLGLRPYYSILLKILKTYMHKYEEQPANMHNNDKPHPIRIYSKDALCSKNMLEDFCGMTQTLPDHEVKLCDLRLTYNSTSMRYFYIYPLETVVELLESEQFYKEVPKHVIVNNLLTVTNVQIIIETLSIVSEEMSKKIKITLAGKDGKKKESISQREMMEREEKDGQNGKLATVIEADTEDHCNITQSQVNIQNLILQQTYDVPEQEQSQENFVQIINLSSQKETRLKWADTKPQPQIKQKEIVDPRLVRTQMPGHRKLTTLSRQSPERQCDYCFNYLYYLSEITNNNFNDQSLNCLSHEAIRCLKLISQTVTHFTLYLIHNEQTRIPKDINLINRILNAIGIVITEDIYASELNPKNIKKPQPSVNKPKNLIQQLQPYFWMVDCKKAKNEQSYSIEQLLRMVIYCPTTKEVAEQLRHYQSELFQQQFTGTKGLEKDQQVKLLLHQECKNMLQYEEERLEIAKNAVNTKPIYKQLQFEEEKVAPPSINPINYNSYHHTTASRVRPFDGSKIPFMNNATMGPSSSKPFSKNEIKDNKSVIGTLSRSLSKLNGNHHRANSGKLDDILGQEVRKKGRNTKDSKKRPTHIKQNTAYDFSLNDCFPMSENIKRNTIKNNQSVGKALIPHQQASSGVSISAQIKEEQLTEDQFRHLLFTAYLKKRKGPPQQSITCNTTPCTPSISFLQNTFTSSFCKALKKSTYSSSLNQLLDRKQELEQIECMQKKEKQIFNKQLLNGENTKKEIYQEMQMDSVKIYENFNNTDPNNKCVRLQCLQVKKMLSVESQKSEDLESNSAKLVRQSSQQRKSNVILQASANYNQTCLIRNQKYNKSIKSQLINHRHSYLVATEKENFRKYHLARSQKQLKHSTRQLEGNNIKLMYQQELQRVLGGL